MSAIGAIELESRPDKAYLILVDQMNVAPNDIKGIIAYLNMANISGLVIPVDNFDGKQIPDSVNALTLQSATDEQLTNLVLAAQELLGQRIIARLENE